MNKFAALALTVASFASQFAFATTRTSDYGVKATDLVGTYSGLNLTQTQACLIEVTRDGSELNVRVQTGNEEMVHPPISIQAVDQAIALGFEGQFNADGESGLSEEGPYFWNLRGGFFKDGRLNYLTIVLNVNRGLYQGGQSNLGCSHLKKIQ